VIVNTTPVGMFPDNGNKPLSLAPFRRCEGVLDVVYNPLRTAFVLEAKALGIPAAGGLAMLAEQAAAGAACFTGRSVPAQKAEETLLTLRRAAENIVLVGMPGCGKSSVGKAVAELLGRDFVDTDTLAERAAGRNIPEIFERHGVAAFRRLEREAVREAGGTGGKVIATGGGVVLEPENYAPLAQNGRIYFLQRALDRLPTEGRPLSRDLAKLYAERLPLYRRFADAEIPEGLTVEEAALAVRDRFYADTK
jgi:shikimate dehydrogenase